MALLSMLNQRLKRVVFIGVGGLHRTCLLIMAHVQCNVRLVDCVNLVVLPQLVLLIRAELLVD
jgi:hypothetical protein